MSTSLIINHSSMESSVMLSPLLNLWRILPKIISLSTNVCKLTYFVSFMLDYARLFNES